MKAYRGVLYRELARNKRYPRRAQRRGQQGRVWLQFVLDRSGSVLNSSIAKSSGHALLDDATLELLRESSPLPAPPAGIPASQLKFLIPVDYNLR